MSEEKDVNKCCADADVQKVKVLAIHGYRQNGDVFHQKTGSFRKMVHKWAQFTYITAPHKVVLVDNLNGDETADVGQSIDSVSSLEISGFECEKLLEQYGWFFNRDNMTFRGIRKGGPAIGYEESVQMIEEVFEKHGPFDGLLGFSQGACFVGLLCDLQHRGVTKIKFNFAIMASGFKSGSLPHMKYYGEPIPLPTLHIFGETDDIIPKEMSEALRDSFEDPTTVVHPGKHYLPAAAPQKHEYQKFFKTCLLRKQHESNVNNMKSNLSLT